VRVLFVHQNFPGQYRHLAPHLATLGHDVTGLGEKANVLRQMPGGKGVRLLGYELPAIEQGWLKPFTASWQRAVHRGRVVARGGMRLVRSGYKPDVVCAHIGWGEALFLKEVFPDAKLLVYAEFYYRPRGSDVGFDPEFPSSPESLLRLRVMNAPLQMAMEAADWGIAPTHWQRTQYPSYFQAKISEQHDGIDTTVVTPDPNASLKLPKGGVLTRRDEVITFVSRNLEPYRGFHIFMRALPALLKRRPKAQVVIIGGDEVSYSPRLPSGQTYRKKMLAELEGKVDWSRVHFINYLPYPEFLSLLRVSSCHVYLTYPFVASWSLQEAQAAECLVVASDTVPVREYVADGKTGLLTDFFDVEGLAAKVDEALRAGKAMDPIRKAARQSVVTKYDLKSVCLPAQVKLLERLAAGELKPQV
jgi:glycosyltransferase involved in cell wall biosynthesis